MGNKVEIDGKWYELVPMEEEYEEIRPHNPTFYFGCDSECGYFQFSILMKDGGELWEDTGSVTYYPNGYLFKDGMECWDNVGFLNNLLDDGLDSNVLEVKDLITRNGGNFEDLKGLLEQVREKGWI